MAISTGEKLPDSTFHHMTEDGPKPLSSGEIFDGKRVFVFALPGAFTPTCSAAHLPGFVVHADEIFAKGVDTIVCLSVNDAFVMGAWGDQQNAEKILMLADGSAAFTQAIGLELDLTANGMGIRSKRYAMIVEDREVKLLNIDASGLESTSAETILAAL